MADEITVMIPEKKEIAEVETTPDTSGLSATEIAMAEKQGLIKGEKKADDAKGEEKKKEAGEEKEAADEEKDAKAVRDAEFEEMSKDPQVEHEKLNKYSKNEQAMYFLRKKDKQKRQQAEAERDHLILKNRHLEEKLDGLIADLEKLKKSGKDKVEDEDDFFSDKESSENEGLTKEQIEKKIEETLAAKKKQEEEAIKSKSELMKTLNERLNNDEAEVSSRYTDYNIVTDIAVDFIKHHDKTGYAYQTVAKALADPEGSPAEVLYSFGKYHPKFKELYDQAQKLGDDGEGRSTKQIDKIVANAGKRKGSANLGGKTGGNKAVSVEDLTLADIAVMSPEEYAKIPKPIRDRLLRESNR